MRINYQWQEELWRVLDDAATPPYDKPEIHAALSELETSNDRYSMLSPIPDEPWLQELRIDAGSGHAYGVVFEEVAAGLDAIAYYRVPPLMIDPRANEPHGYSREHGIANAKERQHDRSR